MTRFHLPCLFLTALFLSGCVEDTRTTDLEREATRPFTNEEMAVLQQTLDVDDPTFIASQRLPQHVAMLTANGSRTVDLDPRDLTKAFLGRVLFYDTQLSATGETSCASCHKQELAFSDDLALSRGINGGFTKRNSIALGSVPTFSPEVSGYGETSDDFTTSQGAVAFFWDERAATIKQQSEMTIEDKVEMGRDLTELAADLRQQEMYRILTRKAYGTEELTADRLTLALEKFCATMTSMDTPFDDMMDMSLTHGQGMTAVEERFGQEATHGMELFNNNCASCHGFNLTQPAVAIASNGLDLNPTDRGVGEHQGSRLNGVFKVPFLRNVALTAPYMHDGRFATLREVIDHYSEGIQAHQNLHPSLTDFNDGKPLRMNFSEEDKRALITFLETTTDRSLLDDRSLSNPFRQ